MSGVQIAILFGAWLTAGFVFWCALTGLGIAFQPRTNPPGRMTRTGIDRRKRPRPGSTERRGAPAPA